MLQSFIVGIQVVLPYLICYFSLENQITSSFEPLPETFAQGCSNTDLAKTSEQLWFSTLIYFASVLRVQQVSCLHHKIYGIAKRSMPLSLISTEVFDAGYGQTVDDVFISFTSLLLRILPTLSPLSTSEGVGLGKRKREELSSWGLDYNIKNSMNLNNRREQIQYGFPDFAASIVDGDSSSPCRIGGRILHVTGKRIHKVSAIGPLMNRMSRTHKMHADAGITRLLDICLKMDPTHNLTDQDRLEVLWRTLIQDIDFDGGRRQQV